MQKHLIRKIIAQRSFSQSKNEAPFLKFHNMSQMDTKWKFYEYKCLTSTYHISYNGNKYNRLRKKEGTI